MAINNLKFLQNKKIAMLGLGVENLALVKYLLKTTPQSLLKKEGGSLNITVCDPKSAAELGERFLEIKLLARKNKLPEIKLISGKNYDAQLADFDIVFRSPGYPLFNKNLIKAKKAGVEISSAMELFFELCPTKNIIGVTGSKGKGTTASLIYEIINSSLKTVTHPVSRGASHPSREGISQRVFLGGNIGTAPFEFIDKIKPNDFVVLELSSFQLEDLKISPKIAVITNIFKEHLAPADPNNPNYHRSMKDYWAAKANIFAYQKREDYLVINEKLKIKKEKRKNIGKIIYYGKSELPSNLIGEHNKENIAAAVAVAKILKIKDEVIKKAVQKFNGLPHRLEFVAEIDGVKYFDDSFATVPDVSVIALRAISDKSPLERGGVSLTRRGVLKSDSSKNFFDSRRIILFAGGADKGSDFKNFAKEIKKRVKYLILFKGKGTDRLKSQISPRPELGTKANFNSQISVVDNMKDAVKIAKSKATRGDIVLLSTGCASFGCFKNYKERGEQFKAEIKKKK
jgi:UDP-N-acetylmuramoylalanine--D-glutamate ligase